MSIVHRIVEKVAQREGVDSVDLDPTLHEVVDIEALEALSSDVDHRQLGRYPSVEFMYHGFAVSTHGDGTVRVEERSSLSDRISNTSDERTAQPDDRERAMTAVADIIGAHDRPFGKRLDRLLDDVTELLGTEAAALSYADNDTYVFEAVAGTENVEVQTGETVPLAETVCKRVIETEEALDLSDIEADAPELADSACEISSYIGVPVFVDGEVYGTFCFYSTDARSEAFTEWSLALVELVSTWVSAELERRARARTLHATTTDRPYSVGVN